jgi:hypothetical protein
MVDVLSESSQEMKFSKFLEMVTRDIDIDYEKVKDGNILYNILHDGDKIAYISKEKRFIKPKFIMHCLGKKSKKMILPYKKGMKIKYGRLMKIVSEFTKFIDVCIKHK